MASCTKCVFWLCWLGVWLGESGDLWYDSIMKILTVENSDEVDL